MRKRTKRCKALRSRHAGWAGGSLEIIAEEPLLIRIDEKPYSVVMRTPGEEEFHAAGFCLGEGIIDSVRDYKDIAYDETSEPNIIDIHLRPERRKKIPGILRRRSFVSRTSCGICGKQLVDDLYQILAPVENGFAIDIEQVFAAVQSLYKKQKYYKKTRGCHAALILDRRLKTIAFAEDVGRHNALDKAIGKALTGGKLASAGLLILSSRASHELVQKAARACIPIVISHSRPTTLAVEMADDLNMTLGFPDNGSGLIVVCGDERIRSGGTKSK